MSETEGRNGSLLFFRKNGEPGASYPLSTGKTSIGSSMDADIRLKLKDERLEDFHCIIDVTEDGIATLVNKSNTAPVGVNTILVRKFKVLRNEDKIELLGKQFQYLNDTLSDKDAKKHEAMLNKAISTPKKRQTIDPVVKVQSTNKTPNLKTRISAQRKLLTRKSFNGNHAELTPERKFGVQIAERPKTTSKLITSKALSSPTRARKRRLSLDYNPSKLNRGAKVSERNILLSKDTVSSATVEEEPLPSPSISKVNNVATNFLDLSNTSFSVSEEGLEQNSVKLSRSIRTPSRSSVTSVETPLKATTPFGKEQNLSRIKTPSKTQTPRTLATSKRSILNGTPASRSKVSPLLKTPVPAMREQETPSSSNVQAKTEAPVSLKKSAKKALTTKLELPDDVTKRHKSFERVALPNKPTPKRRKTEGTQPNVPRQYLSARHSAALSTKKSKITSVDSEDLSDGSVKLNLSTSSSLSPILPRKSLYSTDSDVAERQVLNDPRLSLGKVSPRKSMRNSQPGRKSSYIKNEGETDVKDSQETLTNSLNTSKSRQSLRQNKENLPISTSRISTRRSNMLEKIHSTSDSSDKSPYKEMFNDPQDDQMDEEESSSESVFEESWSSDLNLSKLSSSSSLQEENEFDPKPRSSTKLGDTDEQSFGDDTETVNLSRRSKSSTRQSGTSRASKMSEFQDNEGVVSRSSLSRRSFRSSLGVQSNGNEIPSRGRKEDEDHLLNVSLSSTSSEETSKSVFVSQRRPSLKRSYLEEDKELSICLARSETPQDRRKSSLGGIKPADEDDTPSLSPSDSSYVPRRVSRRRSTNTYCKSCGHSPANVSTCRRSSLKEIPDKNDRLGRFSQSMSYVESLNVSSKSKRSLSRGSVLANKSYDSPRAMSRQNDSVITVGDVSVKNTPENHTSIIILDTPLEVTRRTSQRKLSKTLNSSFEDDVELSTPKSAIKSRRSKSLPYKPIVEEITPVTPQETGNKSESSFKTPMNTPGLFENIKNSVLKSRSRRRLSSNLMDELNKAAKRARESTESVNRTAKKRKVADTTLESVDENIDGSFASFESDEVFSDISDHFPIPNTPQDFKNLTDKPVINDPQAKSMTGPKKQKTAPNRSSLHAMRLESQLSEDYKTSDTNSTSTYSLNTSSSNDVLDESMESRRSSRRLSLKAEEDQMREVYTPMNDLSNVSWESPKNDNRGPRRVLRTPKPAPSPKNDLMQIPNLRKLIYPTQQNSPRNDLTQVAGVKKLLSTPKEIKLPKNDLRNVLNLRKLMSPKQQNSPRNDLSDVAGLKKLLSTPKEQKQPRNDLTNVVGVKKLLSTPKKQNSPKNDLTQVSNLRKIMSPKQQNSPRNDLSDVAGLKKLLSTPKKQKEPRNDLTNIVGVKKLLSTPKKQNSPNNDLTKVPNLRNIMYPKRQKSPMNDLTDVEGVADIFAVPETRSNESDAENNEDLFDRLFVKKPIRTYRGRSLSPITRRATLFGADKRKTLGDPPYSSPRVKQWLEDQAIIKLETVSDVGSRELKEDNEPAQSEDSKVEDTRIKKQPEKKSKARRKAHQFVKEETSEVSSPRTRSRLKTQGADTTSNASESKPPTPAKRVNSKVVVRQEEAKDQVAEINSTTEDTEREPPQRGRNKVTEEVATGNVPTPPVKRGRPRKVPHEEQVAAKGNKRTRGGNKAIAEDLKAVEDIAVPSPPKRKRGRTRSDSHEDSVTLQEPKRLLRGQKAVKKEVEIVTESPSLKKRGRPRKALHGEAESKPGNEGATSDVANEEPQASRRMGKARTVLDDDEVNSADRRQGEKETQNDVEMMDEEISLPKRRGGSRAAKSKKADDITEPKCKARGRKAPKEEAEKTRNEEEENEYQKGNKQKLVAGDVKLPSRRGGRRKIVIDYEEETPDGNNIGTEEDKENVEQKPAKNKSKAKKQPAKTTVRKKMIQEESVSEDSPRATRQRKVNLKYGSDYLTEIKDVNKVGKKVHFEDDGKLEQKGMERTEESAEVVRRSKRTRK